MNMIKLFFNIILIILLLIPSFSRSQDSIRVNQPDNYSTSSSISFLRSVVKAQKDTSVTEIKVFKNQNTNFKKDRNFLAIGLTGGLTAIGAYSAYLFKEISNDEYENYQSNGDESRYDKYKQYNTYFYVTLTLTQVAFAYLMYLIFVDK